MYDHGSVRCDRCGNVTQAGGVWNAQGRNRYAIADPCDAGYGDSHNSWSSDGWPQADGCFPMGLPTKDFGNSGLYLGPAAYKVNRKPRNFPR